MDNLTSSRPAIHKVKYDSAQFKTGKSFGATQNFSSQLWLARRTKRKNFPIFFSLMVGLGEAFLAFMTRVVEGGRRIAQQLARIYDNHHCCRWWGIQTHYLESAYILTSKTTVT